jgi:hypothetical protein
MVPDDSPKGWLPIPDCAPARVTESVRQLHWAAQAVSNAAWTHLGWTPPDDQHTSFDWDPAQKALVGRCLHPATGTKAALRLSDCSLLVLNNGGCPHSLALHGHSMDEAYEWLGAAVSESSGGELVPRLNRRAVEIPWHPIASGRGWDANDRDALEAITRYYANTVVLLASLRQELPRLTRTICWPHQFDVATILPLSTPGLGGAKRIIGVGMAPMGAGIDEPYWYVGPWPPVPGRPTPPLEGGGYWHVDRWYAAVLPASTMLRAAEHATQATAVWRFVTSAVRASRAMLEDLGDLRTSDALTTTSE